MSKELLNNIKTIFDDKSDSTNKSYDLMIYKKLKKTHKFYYKDLTKCSSIYNKLCLNYLNNKNKYDTVSYQHRDGTLHKGVLLENSQILLINDPKLGNIICNDVIVWINKLDQCLHTNFPIF